MSQAVTPAEFDAREFELIQLRDAAAHRIERAIDAAHRLAGDRKAGYGSPQWKMSDQTAEDMLTVMMSEEYGYDTRTRQQAASLADQITADRALVATLSEQVSAMEAMWNHQWTRYFPCLNADGHIHSSLRGCQTVNWNTAMGWATEMSGQDVATAVTNLGETLCSVCFPEAPAQWCRTRSEVTRAEREAARDAKNAERDAKLAVRNLTPGEAAVLREACGESTTTVAAAKALVRKAAETAVELEWLRSGEARKAYTPANGWTDADAAAEAVGKRIAWATERLERERTAATAASSILVSREAAAPGTGWTTEDADRAVISATKRTRRAYFG